MGALGWSECITAIGNSFRKTDIFRFNDYPGFC